MPSPESAITQQLWADNPSVRSDLDTTFQHLATPCRTQQSTAKTTLGYYFMCSPPQYLPNQASTSRSSVGYTSANFVITTLNPGQGGK